MLYCILVCTQKTSKANVQRTLKNRCSFIKMQFILELD